MKQQTVNEDEFFQFHNDLMEQGFRIVRCIEISGVANNGGLKQYFLVWN